MNKKRAPKIKVPCQVCGKVLTRPGLVGHMAWAHQKQYKAPMLPVEKPMIPVGEARHKAALYDDIVKMFENYKPSPFSQLMVKLERLGQGAQENEAFLADFSGLIKEHAAKQGISYKNVLLEVKREKQLIDELAKSLSGRRKRQP